MNKAYRLIWNRAKQAWVVAAETVKHRGALPAAAVISASLLASPALALDPSALPTGGQITAGSGSIAQSGSAMTVTQSSQQMIANWSTFNIGQNASVAFQQPNAAAVALNRIADQNPSQIMGRLSANGQVFLLNPSGIIFGSTARVDVGGLVASSLNLTDANFLAGHYSFEKSGTAGSIINQGIINSANGGYVAFLAPQVKNEGTITANNGSVVMAAADKVNLDFTGDGLISYSVEQGAVDALAENKGLIKADGGMVVLTAKAADSLTSAVVNNDGVIEARGITAQGGRILLDAEDGMTTVTGTLDTSSDTANGGRIVASGERVWVKNGALLTSSGATGGGEVLVGGSWQNSDTSVRQAVGTVIEAGARLEANATDSGNGGTVVAWSDITNPLSVTRAYGSFEAKGGPNGGNGGRIETSGHWLDVAGSQGGASAAHGLAGVWLFDPYNVTITGADANGSWAGGNPDLFSPTDTGSTISAATIAGKLEGGTSVTVTTNGGGAEIGDITVSSAITKTAGDTDVTLTLQAANSIVVDQAISNTGGTGKLNVVLDADNNNGTGDGAGIVLLNADITTNGGSLSFGTGRTATIGGVSTLVGGDVFVGGSAAQTISTNGGAVDVKGEMLIANTNGLTINSNGGNVRFHGLLNSGNQYTFVDKTGSAGSGTWGEARTEAQNGTGGGSAVNDSYLVTINSRLENAVAVRAAGYKGTWIGAYRKDETNGNWFWADGPEANQQFFTQTTNGSGGVTTAGYYSNFGADEPNGSMTFSPAERCGQFYGTAAQWNDLEVATTYSNAQHTAYSVLGFVRETNLAASPLAISAGAGTVTFSGAVGTSKALASLNVTSTNNISINGGAVTTEGLQTYTGNVTLGAAATTLTQTAANTDFTIQSGKTITNATGADASLTIKTTGSILMNSGSSISSSTGKLNTILWSDSDNSASGYIFVHDGNTISSNGGTIVMAGGLDDGANGGTASDGIPDGYAVSTVTTASGVSIGRNANAATAATTITSGGGNILMRGKSTGGSPSMGIHYAYGGTLDAGSGTLTMLGEATNYAGIELSAWLDGAGTSYLDINAGTVDIRGTSSNTNYHGLASSQLNNEYTRITAGAGGIYLYGHNTANTNKGVEISLNATTTGGGNITVESPNYVAIYGGANAHSFNAGTGNTTLKSNLLSIGANHTLAGSGTLTVEPYTAGRAINIGAIAAGALNIASSYFSSNFTNGFSGITIGNATAGAITVGGTTTLNDSTTLLSNSTIAINGAITANENLALTGNGAITQSAALGVTGTTAITAGIGNDITLNNASNDFTGAVSVVSGNNVSLIDSNALTLGSVAAAGTVDIATLTGNLALTGAVATTDTTASAIKLNAGKNAAAGTAAGGDILVTGGSVSTGAGGYATLYSGSVSASTGLTALAVSGSGHFRYNADEATDFSAGGWTALTAGTNAIYREQPTVTTTASDDNKTYSGVPYSGGNGVTYAGFQNGDTSASLGGTLAYGGTSQGAVNTGSYTIIPSGYTNGLGYGLAYANGNLTITEAPAPTPSNNNAINNVVASITSPQPRVNGTQESDNDNKPAHSSNGDVQMGPGAGSAVVVGNYMGGLIQDNTGYRTPEYSVEKLNSDLL
ncbi:MAG TPA: filamentous hemagglutinin N-terminal domain-containing protein [Deltaproteobacteria bacterium]|nr:filamentous hemagglutinin N-terminal domain-containing protein [Deltaproteobacteria bacterium]HQB39071.1 filamentous hemagglutinin N-terminal domain-containing protein [Deltaproteobacteria bacterium]